jgi:thioredoxin 1
MAGHTIEITDDNFDSTVSGSSKPVMIDFWAPWCSPCVAIGPVLESLAEEYKDQIIIGKINVDENANAPVKFGVRSIPYIAMFKNGELVDSVVGAVPKAKLMEMIKKAL